MENTIQQEALELVRKVLEFQNEKLPAGCQLHINCGRDYATIDVHCCKDHFQGLEVKRLLGVKDADKSLFNDSNPWHALKGKITEDVNFNIFCQGLPPMCRVETYEEEIPKTDIVTLAETVKVKRTRICCGSEAQ